MPFRRKEKHQFAKNYSYSCSSNFYLWHQESHSSYIQRCWSDPSLPHTYSNGTPQLGCSVKLPSPTKPLLISWTMPSQHPDSSSTSFQQPTWYFIQTCQFLDKQLQNENKCSAQLEKSFSQHTNNNSPNHSNSIDSNGKNRHFREDDSIQSDVAFSTSH